MNKRLIIAEKPSVAADIAKAIGGFSKEKDYYESNQFVLSSAVGHLLELAIPEEYEIKKGKWNFANIPSIPPRFTVKPIEKVEDRLKHLVKLIKRKDVTGLINACDAGREGELIFSFIAQYAETQKPVERLWLQSMTPDSIRKGIKHLRTAAEVAGLREAAICRAESDWLIGINGTRAMTAFNSKGGGFHLTTVGRVQTPTLAIMVEREEKIRHFKPVDYWEVEALFKSANGEYPGRWFDEQYVKPNEATPNAEHANAYRLWDKAQAQHIQEKCAGKQGSVEEESKISSQLSPPLYDLTSLQRDANSRFGFSAKTTLQIAQVLYEKHKALTYPRTDARALPEDYVNQVPNVLSSLEDRFQIFSKEIIESHWIRPNKRIFNNEKISDHFAIIPTGTIPRGLSEAEEKIYDLVTKRFLAVFYPASEHKVTTRITRIEGEAFKTEGKILIKEGWLKVYAKSAIKASDNEEYALFAISPGEKIKALEVAQKDAQTKPPARLNEATLLSSMEGAGKMVISEELRAALAGRGLGTPATRAQIIENLIGETYVLREGKELVPTAKASSLITLLRGLGIKELISPELTGEWEFKLSQIEKGMLTRTQFMDSIHVMVRDIANRAKQYEADTIPGNFATLKAKCPKCGGIVKETYKHMACQSCDWHIWKAVAGKQLEISEMETLISTGKLGPIAGFRNKMGKLFTAELRLDSSFQTEFDFGQPKERASDQSVDFTNQAPLGKCPKCKGRVYEHGASYVCEKAVGEKHACDFRSGKTVLQQPIDSVQMEKILKQGKSDVLHGFVSSRTRRKFSAMLVFDKQGKLSFEFEKKEPGSFKPGKKKSFFKQG